MDGDGEEEWGQQLGSIGGAQGTGMRIEGQGHGDGDRGMGTEE